MESQPITNVNESGAESAERSLTVFYHGGCADGITGAWAIFSRLEGELKIKLAALGGIYTEGRKPWPSVEAQLAVGPAFIGIAHDDPRPDVNLVMHRDVVYVDITPPEEILAWVIELAETVTILDHHKSAEGTIRRGVARDPERVTAIYDDARSGAQLGWDWAVGTSPRPAIVDYVADRDLWTFRLPNSRAINKALYVEGVTSGFVPLSERMIFTGGKVDEAVARRGEAYLRNEEQMVGRIVANARPVTVSVHLPDEETPRDYVAMAVNTPILVSEVGEAIMEKAPPSIQFAVMWSYVHDRHEIWASVRTNRPDVDLSRLVPRIVGARNGGGHAKAAGFTIGGDRVARVLRGAAP